MMNTDVPLAPLDQWRQRLGGRRRRCQPRPVAGMGFLTDCPANDGLIEIERLTMVLLYDEPIRLGECALRVVGFSANRIPWGVRFGGRAHCRFLKDLMLQPVPGGGGYRLDQAHEELLTLGLQLDRDLDRHLRFHKRVRDRPLLPKLWAGFQPHDAQCLYGDGPEMESYATRTGRDAACLLQHLRRDHRGLTLFPLSWVSHHWQQAAAIFADLAYFPKRQVFRLHGRDDLAGFHDAAEFDFLSRSGCKRPRSRQHRHAYAAA